LNKIVLVLIAVTAVSGVAVLSNNVFTIDLQPYMIFNSFDEFADPICTCQGLDAVGNPEYTQENCQGFSNGFSDPNMLCTAVAGLEGYGSPGDLGFAQGCGVGFWKNNRASNLATTESESSSVWPEGYQPEFYFNDMFLTTINLPQNEPDVEISKIAKNENDKDKKYDVKDDDDVLREKSSEKIAKNDEDKKHDVKDDDEILRDESSEKIAKSENDKDKKYDVKDDDEILREKSDDGLEDGDSIKDEAVEKGPTLLDALNAKDGDMNSLLRHSVTAMLNAAHPDINYPYSVIQVIELTQISIINEDYQNTIDMFEKFNEELEKPSMCLE